MAVDNGNQASHRLRNIHIEPIALIVGQLTFSNLSLPLTRLLAECV